nr:MAG TPA: hypothetical protein [Caudoviricetes sp.]
MVLSWWPFLRGLKIIEGEPPQVVQRLDRVTRL